MMAIKHLCEQQQQKGVKTSYTPVVVLAAYGDWMAFLFFYDGQCLGIVKVWKSLKRKKTNELYDIHD